MTKEDTIEGVRKVIRNKHMKDKIAEVILEWDSLIADKGLAEDMAIEILDLIAKELPKEEYCEEHKDNSNAYFCAVESHKECPRCKIYVAKNRLLTDIKHKLGVE